MTTGPIRDLTPRQVQVAAGIGRGLSYAQIASELRKTNGERVSTNTIRNTVRAMALIFDEPKELAPRWRIYMWVKQGEWEAERSALGTSVAR